MANDELTVEQVLDVPVWSNELKEARFATLEQFEEFMIDCESLLQQQLVTYDYNTFNSFLQFYNNYRKENNKKKQKKNTNNNNNNNNRPAIPLINFVSNYKSRIAKDSLSCVGLSIQLIRKLRQTNQRFSRSIGLVSCEEAVKDTGAYTIQSPNNVKEHCMVCIKVNIGGRRSGYALLDPGYHIARPIIVMEDNCYPHTSWFTFSANPKVTKEYCYFLIDHQFIGWKVRETRNGILDEWENLIYVNRQFAKCLTITEKRSLIYSMKSLVVRNRKGPVAGIYSWIESNSVTLFYEDNGRRVQKKLDINQIGSDWNVIDEWLEKIASFMNDGSGGIGGGIGGHGIDERVKQLRHMLLAFKEALNDEEFLPQLTEIDKWIETDE
ncbi:uncharacterized protein LOC128958001 [Oppia nitens]|uniref:uncharacterized protein LOC128958001 n=1 Tax=Oppia nitens TaxID=1686743 RepID=UPI0023DA40F7|nr:uncharacterized protein LOC128958001 [Oppia nitens]